MDLTLKDFLPAYPDYNPLYKDDFFRIFDDENVNDTYYKKEEFYQNKLSESETPPDAPGIPLSHQRNISRFLTPYTLNDEMLLFHGVGSGKTCSSVHIAELAKSINPEFKRTLVLVKGKGIKRNFIRELAFKCTNEKYIPDNYHNLTEGEKVTRMNKLISQQYDIHTFETFAKLLSKMTDDNIKKTYSNRVVIIDEVHNIRIQPLKKKGELDVYKEIHRMLHLITNRKIILLSATPMRDRPEEFASIMNLLLPLEEQLPTGKDFVKKYYQDGLLVKPKTLKKKIKGRVSYVRSLETDIKKIHKGFTLDPMKKIVIYPSNMKKIQLEGYIDAFKKDSKENKDIDLDNVDDNNELSDNIEEEEETTGQSLYDKSRQASLFVFPDKSYGSEGFKKYLVRQGTDYVLTTEFKNILTDNNTLDVEGIIDNISKYSSIYANTLKEIYNKPKENTFVYNRFVEGSGAILFSELLKLIGYSKGTSSNIDFDAPPTKRFSLITGTSISDVEVDKVLNLFNNPLNKHGEYIQVVIGSQVIGEGKSLKNVRQVHIQTPHWNNSETEQAIGRGIRAFSHLDLNEDERVVKVYRHCALNSKGKSINFMMYKLSEDKDFLIKQVERVCKESAVDCALNYKRNHLATDIDDSRECDYQSCDYKCDSMMDDLTMNDIISDSYNFYFAEEEIEALQNNIKEKFKYKFSYDLNELIDYIGYEISPMVIIRALKNLIDNFIPIKNRYGFTSYVKEDKNLYFLVDSVKTPSSFFLEYYTHHPSVRQPISFEDTIENTQSIYSEDNIKNITSLNPLKDRKEMEKRLEGLSPLLKEFFIEYAIIADIKGSGKTEFNKTILDIYKNYIIQLKDKTVSSYLVESEGLLRCLDKNKEEWYNCKVEVEKEIEEIQVEEKEVLENNPYGFYGMISKDLTEKYRFQIKDVEDKNEKDRRKKARGKACMKINNKNIIAEYINTINLKHNNDVIKPSKEDLAKHKKLPKTKDELIKEILTTELKFTKSELKELDIDRLTTIYYYVKKASKNEQCDNLQQWFENNKLLKYEK